MTHQIVLLLVPLLLLVIITSSSSVLTAAATIQVVDLSYLDVGYSFHFPNSLKNKNLIFEPGNTYELINGKFNLLDFPDGIKNQTKIYVKNSSISRIELYSGIVDGAFIVENNNIGRIQFFSGDQRGRMCYDATQPKCNGLNNIINSDVIIMNNVFQNPPTPSMKVARHGFAALLLLANFSSSSSSSSSQADQKKNVFLIENNEFYETVHTSRAQSDTGFHPTFISLGNPSTSLGLQNSIINYHKFSISYNKMVHKYNAESNIRINIRKLLNVFEIAVVGNIINLELYKPLSPVIGFNLFQYDFSHSPSSSTSTSSEETKFLIENNKIKVVTNATAPYHLTREQVALISFRVIRNFTSAPELFQPIKIKNLHSLSVSNNFLDFLHVSEKNSYGYGVKFISLSLFTSSGEWDSLDGQVMDGTKEILIENNTIKMMNLFQKDKSAAIMTDSLFRVRNLQLYSVRNNNIKMFSPFEPTCIASVFASLSDFSNVIVENNTCSTQVDTIDINKILAERKKQKLSSSFSSSNFVILSSNGIEFRTLLHLGDISNVKLHNLAGYHRGSFISISKNTIFFPKTRAFSIGIKIDGRNMTDVNLIQVADNNIQIIGEYVNAAELKLLSSPTPTLAQSFAIQASGLFRNINNITFANNNIKMVAKFDPSLSSLTPGERYAMISDLLHVFLGFWFVTVGSSVQQAIIENAAEFSANIGVVVFHKNVIDIEDFGSTFFASQVGGISFNFITPIFGAEKFLISENSVTISNIVYTPLSSVGAFSVLAGTKLKNIKSFIVSKNHVRFKNFLADTLSTTTGTKDSSSSQLVLNTTCLLQISLTTATVSDLAMYINDPRISIFQHLLSSGVNSLDVESTHAKVNYVAAKKKYTWDEGAKEIIISENILDFFKNPPVVVGSGGSSSSVLYPPTTLFFLNLGGIMKLSHGIFIEKNKIRAQKTTTSSSTTTTEQNSCVTFLTLARTFGRANLAPLVQNFDVSNNGCGILCQSVTKVFSDLKIVTTNGTLVVRTIVIKQNEILSFYSDKQKEEVGSASIVRIISSQPTTLLLPHVQYLSVYIDGVDDDSNNNNNNNDKLFSSHNQEEMIQSCDSDNFFGDESTTTTKKIRRKISKGIYIIGNSFSTSDATNDVANFISILNRAAQTEEPPNEEDEEEQSTQQQQQPLLSLFSLTNANYSLENSIVCFLNNNIQIDLTKRQQQQQQQQQASSSSSPNFLFLQNYPDSFGSKKKRFTTQKGAEVIVMKNTTLNIKCPTGSSETSSSSSSICSFSEVFTSTTKLSEQTSASSSSSSSSLAIVENSTIQFEVSHNSKTLSNNKKVSLITFPLVKSAIFVANSSLNLKFVSTESSSESSSSFQKIPLDDASSSNSISIVSTSKSLKTFMMRKNNIRVLSSSATATSTSSTNFFEPSSHRFSIVDGLQFPMIINFTNISLETSFSSSSFSGKAFHSLILNNNFKLVSPRIVEQSTPPFSASSLTNNSNTSSNILPPSILHVHCFSFSTKNNNDIIMIPPLSPFFYPFNKNNLTTFFVSCGENNDNNSNNNNNNNNLDFTGKFKLKGSFSEQTVEAVAATSNVASVITAISGAPATASVMSRGMINIKLMGCRKTDEDGNLWISSPLEFPYTLFPSSVIIGEKLAGGYARAAIVSICIFIFVVAPLGGLIVGGIKYYIESENDKIKNKPNDKRVKFYHIVPFWIVRFTAISLAQFVTALAEASGLLLISSSHSGGDIALAILPLLLILTLVGITAYLLVTKVIEFPSSSENKATEATRTSTSTRTSSSSTTNETSSSSSNSNSKELKFVRATLKFSSSSSPSSPSSPSSKESFKTQVEAFLLSSQGSMCATGRCTWMRNKNSDSNSSSSSPQHVALYPVLQRTQGCYFPTKRELADSNSLFQKRDSLTILRDKLRGTYFGPFFFLILVLASLFCGLFAGFAKASPEILCKPMLTLIAVINSVLAFVMVFLFPLSTVPLRASVDTCIEVGNGIVSIVVAVSSSYASSSTLITFVHSTSTALILGGTVALLIVVAGGRLLLIYTGGELVPIEEDSATTTTTTTTSSSRNTINRSSSSSSRPSSSGSSRTRNESRNRTTTSNNNNDNHDDYYYRHHDYEHHRQGSNSRRRDHNDNSSRGNVSSNSGGGRERSRDRERDMRHHHDNDNQHDRHHYESNRISRERSSGSNRNNDYNRYDDSHRNFYSPTVTSSSSSSPSRRRSANDYHDNPYYHHHHEDNDDANSDLEMELLPRRSRNSPSSFHSNSSSSFAAAASSSSSRANNNERRKEENRNRERNQQQQEYNSDKYRHRHDNNDRRHSSPPPSQHTRQQQQENRHYSSYSSSSFDRNNNNSSGGSGGSSNRTRERNSSPRNATTRHENSDKNNSNRSNNNTSSTSGGSDNRRSSPSRTSNRIRREDI